MARLHGYLNDRGYYIKHSFLADRRLLHVVYQVSREAEQILMGQGLKDGDLLPDDIFYSLREAGKIFTNRQGVEGIPLERERLSNSGAVTPDNRIRQGVAQQAADAPREAGHHPAAADLSEPESFSASALRKKLRAANPGWSNKTLRQAVRERIAAYSDASKAETGPQLQAVFERLSSAARNWVGVRVSSHPSARIVESWEGTDGEVHYTLEGIPEHFWEQLLRVAVMCDGTRFFENLDRSYQPKKSTSRTNDGGKAT
jgi:hypothetical protein